MSHSFMSTHDPPIDHSLQEIIHLLDCVARDGSQPSKYHLIANCNAVYALQNKTFKNNIKIDP